MKKKTGFLPGTIAVFVSWFTQRTIVRTVVVGVVLVAIVGSYPVMIICNWIMTAIFGMEPITFSQASIACLVVACIVTIVYIILSQRRKKRTKR